MAQLDADSDAVVIRVVYDGPPSSGKTTSLRALAGQLSERRRTPVFSPQEAYNGRTLYFDWMVYEGGLIDGRRVRCQIVTVPGQSALADRRRFLLRAADTVIFVADTRETEIAAAREYFDDLKPNLSRGDQPPVGIVLQANKRDLADAVPLPDLRRIFEDPNLGIVESTATRGKGVREAFVFGVRLALDRARELIKEGTLAVGPPEIASGEALLDRLRQAERAGSLARRQSPAESPPESSSQSPVPAASAARKPQEPAGDGRIPLSDEAPSNEPPANEPMTDEPPANESPPRLPDSGVATGLVWPPVTGRVVLKEIETVRAEPRRVAAAEGGWKARLEPRWRIVSVAAHLFPRLEDGRRALLACVREHIRLATLLSAGRCLSLATTGHGGYRIWQALPLEQSLHDALCETLLDAEPRGLAEGLFDVARRLNRALALFGAVADPLPVSLNTVGADETEQGEPVYLGPLPEAGREHPEIGLGDLLRRELPGPLRELLSPARRHHPGVVDRLRSLGATEPETGAVVDHLLAILADD